jgi:hypothetical protein
MKATTSFDGNRPAPSAVAAGSSLQRPTPPWLKLIRDAVDASDFGTIQIKVHGGEVVQIETTRKIRVPSQAPQFPFHPTAPAEEQP